MKGLVRAFLHFVEGGPVSVDAVKFFAGQQPNTQE